MQCPGIHKLVNRVMAPLNFGPTFPLEENKVPVEHLLGIDQGMPCMCRHLVEFPRNMAMAIRRVTETLRAGLINSELDATCVCVLFILGNNKKLLVNLENRS